MNLLATSVAIYGHLCKINIQCQDEENKVFWLYVIVQVVSCTGAPRPK